MGRSGARLLCFAAWLAVGGCAESRSLCEGAEGVCFTPDAAARVEPGEGLAYCANPGVCPPGFACVDDDAGDDGGGRCVPDAGWDGVLRLDVPRPLGETGEGVPVDLFFERNGTPLPPDATGYLILRRLGPEPAVRYVAPAEGAPFPAALPGVRLPLGRHRVTLRITRADEMDATPLTGTLQVNGPGAVVIDQRVRRVRPVVRFDGVPAAPIPEGFYGASLAVGDASGLGASSALRADGVLALRPGPHRGTLSSWGILDPTPRWPTGTAPVRFDVVAGDGVQDVPLDVPTARRTLRLTVDGRPPPDGTWRVVSHGPVEAGAAELWLLGEPGEVRLEPADASAPFAGPGQVPVDLAGAGAVVDVALATAEVRVDVTANGAPLADPVVVVEDADEPRSVVRAGGPDGTPDGEGVTLVLRAGRSYRLHVAARTAEDPGFLGSWTAPESFVARDGARILVDVPVVEQAVVIDDPRVEGGRARRRLSLEHAWDDVGAPAASVRLPEERRVVETYRVAPGTHDVELSLSPADGGVDGVPLWISERLEDRIVDGTVPLRIEPAPASLPVRLTHGGGPLEPPGPDGHLGTLRLGRRFPQVVVLRVPGSAFEVPLPSGARPLHVSHDCAPEDGCVLPPRSPPWPFAFTLLARGLAL